VVGDEIDDVEEPLESVVLAVIFFCMEKVFGDPCRVLSKTEIEEGESEVEQHGEGKVDDDAVVWKVDGSVIFGSWIVVGVMAMLEHVESEEEEQLEQRRCHGPELQVQWVSFSVQVAAWLWVVPM
jgi:hypothetical protein